MELAPSVFYFVVYLEKKGGYMVDVILYSVLAGFILILLGVVIYVRFRAKINEFPFKEKINRLKTHFQKYHYWYLAITVIVLAPILTYYLDSVLNPSRFKPPPEIYVPPPQTVANNNIIVLQIFKLFVPLIITILASVLLSIVSSRIFKFKKHGFLSQFPIELIVRISLILIVAGMVAKIFIFIVFFSIDKNLLESNGTISR